MIIDTRMLEAILFFMVLLKRQFSSTLVQRVIARSFWTV
jgi:hypothetical protein